MSASLIEQAVDEYMEKNPEFTPPESSQHPAVLALTTEMNPAIVDKFGGIIEFWWAMFEAAKSWFKPNEDSLEYNYFRTRLFGALGLSVHTDHVEDMNEIWNAFVAWKNYGLH